MLFRSPQREIAFGRPLAAVFGGLLLPALPAAFIVLQGDAGLNDVMAGDSANARAFFLVAASLMTAPLLSLAAPLIALVMIVILAVIVWIAAILQWAGPLTLIALSWLIGLPFAHTFFNGDLTTEAPEMIPFLATTLAIQAICGWLVLRPWKEKLLKKLPEHQGQSHLS